MAAIAKEPTTCEGAYSIVAGAVPIETLAFDQLSLKGDSVGLICRSTTAATTTGTGTNTRDSRVQSIPMTEDVFQSWKDDVARSHPHVAIKYNIITPDASDCFLSAALRELTTHMVLSHRAAVPDLLAACLVHLPDLAFTQRVCRKRWPKQSDQPIMAVVMVMESFTHTAHDIFRHHCRDMCQLTRALGSFANALHSLHKYGVVHRDVKPNNCMFKNFDTPQQRCVIIDFNLASIVENCTDPEISECCARLKRFFSTMMNASFPRMRTRVRKVPAVGKSPSAWVGPECHLGEKACQSFISQAAHKLVPDGPGIDISENVYSAVFRPPEIWAHFRASPGSDVFAFASVAYREIFGVYMYQFQDQELQTILDNYYSTGMSHDPVFHANILGRILVVLNQAPPEAWQARKGFALRLRGSRRRQWESMVEKLGSPDAKKRGNVPRFPMSCSQSLRDSAHMERIHTTLRKMFDVNPAERPPLTAWDCVTEGPPPRAKRAGGSQTVNTTVSCWLGKRPVIRPVWTTTQRRRAIDHMMRQYQFVGQHVNQHAPLSIFANAVEMFDACGEIESAPRPSPSRKCSTSGIKKKISQPSSQHSARKALPTNNVFEVASACLFYACEMAGIEMEDILGHAKLRWKAGFLVVAVADALPRVLEPRSPTQCFRACKRASMFRTSTNTCGTRGMHPPLTTSPCSCSLLGTTPVRFCSRDQLVDVMAQDITKAPSALAMLALWKMHPGQPMETLSFACFSCGKTDDAFTRATLLYVIRKVSPKHIPNIWAGLRQVFQEVHAWIKKEGNKKTIPPKKRSRPRSPPPEPPKKDPKKDQQTRRFKPLVHVPSSSQYQDGTPQRPPAPNPETWTRGQTRTKRRRIVPVEAVS